MNRRVGANIERLVGSAAVGNKSASRNESGKLNDTAEMFPSFEVWMEILGKG